MEYSDYEFLTIAKTQSSLSINVVDPLLFLPDKLQVRADVSAKKKQL
jgi:hypothetical protein